MQFEQRRYFAEVKQKRSDGRPVQATASPTSDSAGGDQAPTTHAYQTSVLERALGVPDHRPERDDSATRTTSAAELAASVEQLQAENEKLGTELDVLTKRWQHAAAQLKQQDSSSIEDTQVASVPRHSVPAEDGVDWLFVRNLVVQYLRAQRPDDRKRMLPALSQALQLTYVIRCLTNGQIYESTAGGRKKQRCRVRRMDRSRSSAMFQAD